MSIQNVPLGAVPNQQLNITLAQQPTILHVYQKLQGLFIDVYLNGTLIIAGVIAENKNLIIRNAYLGYDGDFIFFDSLGDSDPEYSELGSRYRLLYYSAEELPY